MATGSQSGALADAAKEVELIEALQHVIDRNCRRLLKLAKEDWERLFGGKEPADACVSVRVGSAAVGAAKRNLPGSQFPSKRGSHAESKSARTLCLIR